MGIFPVVASAMAHYGEESCLVGSGGSGTIFFSGCNLSCIFCQNYDISQLNRGEQISFKELSALMLSLQAKGCFNINFVTPTHMLHAIVKALLTAIPEGLNIPLVYNCGGYESAGLIKMINGVFDIYMPDFKYMNSETAGKLSGVPDYPETALSVIREMFNQVGDLQINSRGIAVRGLLVRHLVLPNNIAASDKIMEELAAVSKETYINIMDQYRPEYNARQCFDLRRRVTPDEYDEVVRRAREAGLRRINL